VKAEELRTLDGEELSSRLKGARRELYELRFKLAVGQLDDHRQIRKVRKDIARILTVVHARRLGEEIQEAPAVADLDVAVPAPEAAVAVEEAEAEAPVTATDEAVAQAAAEAPNEETPEDVETAGEAPTPAPASRRTSRRKPAAEQEND
jgi:large subunit ribosomal protein L29